jgi:hypothetical protein
MSLETTIHRSNQRMDPIAPALVLALVLVLAVAFPLQMEQICSTQSNQTQSIVFGLLGVDMVGDGVFIHSGFGVRPETTTTATTTRSMM